MIVPDASVLVDILRHSDGWKELVARLFRDGETLHVPHVVDLWDLRDSLTAYDASYVSLAEALEATLLTRDFRLARATGHRARIEVV